MKQRRQGAGEQVRQEHKEITYNKSFRLSLYSLPSPCPLPMPNAPIPNSRLSLAIPLLLVAQQEYGMVLSDEHQ